MNLFPNYNCIVQIYSCIKHWSSAFHTKKQNKFTFPKSGFTVGSWTRVAFHQPTQLVSHRHVTRRTRNSSHEGRDGDYPHSITHGTVQVQSIETGLSADLLQTSHQTRVCGEIPIVWCVLRTAGDCGEYCHTVDSYDNYGVRGGPPLQLHAWSSPLLLGYSYKLGWYSVLKYWSVCSGPWWTPIFTSTLVWHIIVLTPTLICQYSLLPVTTILCA